MVNISQLIDEFRVLDWDQKILSMQPLRRGVRRITIRNTSYRLSKTGVFRLKREFRKEICEYNRKQPIDQPIRSIFSGEFVSPGTSIYTRSLRACRLERIHSTCREILTQDPFPHPRTGFPVSPGSVLGRALRRKCQ